MSLDKLLVTLGEIKSKIPDAWLAIAGKGSLKAALEEQTTELELNEYVKFLVFLPDDQF